MPTRNAHQNKPAWGILAPASLQTMQEESFSAWRRLHPGLDSSDLRWIFMPGVGAYTALLDDEPGSEGSDVPLAEELSLRIPGNLYMLRFTEDNQVVWIYRDGRRVEEIGDSPWDVAIRLDCPLPGAPTAQISGAVTRSLCLAMNATEGEVAHSLGLRSVPESGPLHIQAIRQDVLVYSEAGNAAIFAGRISANTGCRVYLLASHGAGRAFSCEIIEAGESIGIYETPQRLTSDLLQLESIVGQTTPLGIVISLGVPPGLLGIS